MDAILKFMKMSSNDVSAYNLSQPAIDLIIKTFNGIDEIYDMHTHVAGSEQSVTGCCGHSNANSIFHPFNFGQKLVLKSSAGMSNDVGGDEEYFLKLVERTIKFCVVKPAPVYKHLLLAMTWWRDKNGKKIKEQTSMYIPNKYMMALVDRYPDIFLPCISVHPYDPKSLNKLEKYAAKGVRFIKWLPNSMGINPCNELCIPFYLKMKELKMILLCHTGDEHAMSCGDVKQQYGNPLLLRMPLDYGVKVIAAHCASEGENDDFDNPLENNRLINIKRQFYKKESNFRLFLRLMDTPKYEKLLFADISSMLLFSRIGDPLTTMLDRTDLHDRLMFGSDYPVPTIGFISRTDKLVQYGYITAEERILLNEIFDYNPLLFDFVGKRIVRSPKSGNKFSENIFGQNINLFS